MENAEGLLYQTINEDEIYKGIGARLRLFRKIKDLSQTKVAQAVRDNFSTTTKI